LIFIGFYWILALGQACARIMDEQNRLPGAQAAGQASNYRGGEVHEPCDLPRRSI